MQKLRFIASLAVVGLAAPFPSPAALLTGFVRCDANQNQTSDAADLPIANVRVTVVSQTGSFSKSVYTAANGSFSMQIPSFDPLAYRRDPLSQTYVETLDASTLPAGSSILVPQPISYISSTPAYYIDYASANLTTFVFNSGAGASSTGNWLINSPNCESRACGLTGGGTISGTNRRPEHSFSGFVAPTVSRNGVRRGHWVHGAVAEKLLFQSTLVQSVTCGTVPGAPANSRSAVNMIEFSGFGTLKGTRGNKTKYPPVSFTVRVEDHGQPGRGLDRYFLRVYSSDGTTLLLVSGNPSNPQDTLPVPISTGNLKIATLR